MKKESEFQSRLIKDIKSKYPDSIVLKNDPRYLQGVPDLIILNGPRWAALECKRTESSTKRPNQDYYVEKMNKMSFARFVCPKNKEAVLDAMDKAFKNI